MTSTAGTITIPFPTSIPASDSPQGESVLLDITQTGIETAVRVFDGCQGVDLDVPLAGPVSFTPALACISTGGTVTLQAVGRTDAGPVSFAAAIDVVPAGIIALPLNAAFDVLPVAIQFPAPVNPERGNVWLERGGRMFGATSEASWESNGNFVGAEFRVMGRSSADSLVGYVSGRLALSNVDLGFYVEQRQLDTSGFDAVLELPAHALDLSANTDGAIAWAVSGAPDWTAVLLVYRNDRGALQVINNVVAPETRSFALEPVPECLVERKRWDPIASPLLAQIAMRDSTYGNGLQDFPGFWSGNCFFYCGETVAAERRPPEYRLWMTMTSIATE